MQLKKQCTPSQIVEFCRQGGAPAPDSVTFVGIPLAEITDLDALRWIATYMANKFNETQGHLWSYERNIRNVPIPAEEPCN